MTVSRRRLLGGCGSLLGIALGTTSVAATDGPGGRAATLAYRRVPTQDELPEDDEFEDEGVLTPEAFEFFLDSQLAEQFGGEVVEYEEGEDWGELAVISGSAGDEDVLRSEIGYIAGSYSGYVVHAEEPPSQGIEVEMQTLFGEPAGWFSVETELAERFARDQVSEIEFVLEVLETLEAAD